MCYWIIIGSVTYKEHDDVAVGWGLLSSLYAFRLKIIILYVKYKSVASIKYLWPSYQWIVQDLPLKCGGVKVYSAVGVDRWPLVNQGREPLWAPGVSRAAGSQGQGCERGKPERRLRGQAGQHASRGSHHSLHTSAVRAFVSVTLLTHKALHPR